LYETAPRIVDSLAAIAAVLGDRQVAEARELTKLHEEVIRGAALAVRDEFERRDSVKGEITLVIAPPDAESLAAPQAMVDAALLEAATAMPAGKAAAEIAKRFGLSKKEAYARLLGLKEPG
jgi:16S rRNA (cytidine1402-2'-O)-methyltransferase